MQWPQVEQAAAETFYHNPNGWGSMSPPSPPIPGVPWP
jgi:hypothetical protein